VSRGGADLALRAKLVVLVALLTAWPSSGFAHGLLLRLENTNTAVAGVAYYTNGAIAAGEYVELVDLDAPPGAVPVGTPTDAAGGFRFAARAGGRYRLLAHGDEGHVTELEFTLGEAKAPRLVDGDEESAGPPAWAVIGGVLVLATGALLLRRLSRYGRASAASRDP
jgi:hypothetical protein